MIQTVIRDFQSIEEAKITIKGVTLIVGESNQGKSACLRALQAACTNRFKAGQVKHGKDYAVIRIKTEESPDILTVARSWSGGSPNIQLGDRRFSKLGRTLPKEVSDFLNLGFVDLNGETYSCNFHPQFQKPMLLEYSQQKVMEILSASTALDDLKETKEELMSVRAKNKGAISAVEGIILDTRSKLDTAKTKAETFIPVFDEFDIKFTNLEALETQLSNLKALETQLSNLEAVIDKSKELMKLDNELDKVKLIQSLQTDTDLLVKKKSILEAIVTRYNPDLEERLKTVLLLESLDKSLNVVICQEAKQVVKERTLSEIVLREDKLKSYNNKRLQLDQLETNLKGLNILISSEKSLVKVVEEHECPICGNKVNFQ